VNTDREYRLAKRLVLGTALSAGLAGCAGLPECARPTQYVLVERQQAEVSGISAPPEVTATHTYDALHANFKTVALRLPDNCYEAALHPGGNRETSELESRCGIPLQVLEMMLTNAGFQVLSWTTLMGIEHQQNVPVHVAAQQLGADIVIVVNDEYTGPDTDASAAQTTYRYFNSNARGERLEPAQIYESDAGWLQSFVTQRMGNNPSAKLGTSLQAHLNATVVLAKGTEPPPAPNPSAHATTPAPQKGAAPTARPGPAAPPPPPQPETGRSGEAIWFYNWQLAKQASQERELEFLFSGIPIKEYASVFPNRAPLDQSDPNRHYWWPVAPAQVEAVPLAHVDHAVSESKFESAVAVPREEQAKLFRAIVKDFIERFRGI
jgi:hypothetical protein